MHSRTRLPEPVLRLLHAQAGVVSRAQLTSAGMTPAQIRSVNADWLRLAHGIYLAGSTFTPPTFTARAWAGVLLGGQGARLGGLSAALLHGLAEPGRAVAGYQAPEALIQVVTPARVRRGCPGFEIRSEAPGFRLASLGADPPRLRVEDTVLDLCRAARNDEEQVITWLTRACQRRLTSPARLLTRLQARPGFVNRRLITAVLGDVDAGATSHLEHRALVGVFRPHGLRDVTLQVRTGSRGRIADAAFVEQRVLIELDGRLGHVEEGAWRDRERDNAHAVEGWLTLRFGWREIAHDACGVAAQITAVLQRRGRRLPARRCPRCRR